MLKIITKTKDIYNNNCVNQNINDKNIINNGNRLLILLTIIFGMGFNSGMVYGSSELEPINIPMKIEEYLVNYILKYDGFYEMSVNLFNYTAIISRFNELKIDALINGVNNLLIKQKEFKKEEKEFGTRLEKLIKDLQSLKSETFDYYTLVFKINSFIIEENKIRNKEKSKLGNLKLSSISSLTNIKISRSIVYNGIDDPILSYSLWLPKYRSYSYSVIRRINDLLLYDDGIVTDLSKKALLDSLNKPLVASRRLLLSSIVDSDLVLNGSSLMEDISTKFSKRDMTLLLLVE